MSTGKLITIVGFIVFLLGCNDASTESDSSSTGDYHFDLYVGTNSSDANYPAIMGINNNGYDVYTGEPFWIEGSYYSEADNIDFSVGPRWGLTADHSVSGTISGDDMVVNIIDDANPDNNATLTLSKLDDEDRVALSDLEGTWVYSDPEMINTLYINSMGEFTGSSNQGCAFSGEFSEKNVLGYYSAEITVVDCVGDFQYVNGVFNGSMIALKKDYTSAQMNTTTALYLLATENTDDAIYAFFVDKFVMQ